MTDHPTPAPADTPDAAPATPTEYAVVHTPPAAAEVATPEPPAPAADEPSPDAAPDTGPASEAAVTAAEPPVAAVAAPPVAEPAVDGLPAADVTAVEPAADEPPADAPAVAEAAPAADELPEPPAAAERLAPPDEPAPPEPEPAPETPAVAAVAAPVAEPAVPEPPPQPAAEELAAEEPAAEPEPPPESKKKWYVVKVATNREESIKAAIERRVKIEGLEEFFGQIVIPVERQTVIKKVKETKNGEKVTREKRDIKEVKKYPGYLMAEVEFNDRVLYLFRETSGVGDFVGATGPLKPPPPMTDLEVRRMLGEQLTPDDLKKDKNVVVKLDYEKGDKVRIREGAFANMEGEVKVITTPKEPGETPKVTVEVSIFGRPVPVDLDYWQVDRL